MASKKNPLEALEEIADHYDNIKGMNPHQSETLVLETIARATSQPLANVKKRWRVIQGVEWPTFDYLERGVVGMNRAAMLVDNNLTPAERQEALEQSLNENVSDTQFKDWLVRYVEKKQRAS